MKELIIVGNGLSAMVLAHSFYKTSTSFLIIGDPNLSNSSRVAAGIWNPVVFKRMTKSWMAHDLISELEVIYKECEKRLQTQLITKRNILRSFTEEQEKVLWKKKAKGELKHFIDEQIYQDATEELSNLKLTNGYSRITEAGTLNVKAFIEASEIFFKPYYTKESFDFSQLKVSENEINYKGILANQILFCEGYCVKDNPYFNWIPLKPAKGEVIRIAANGLKLGDNIFNKNGFIFSTGKNVYTVGSTYNWKDLDDSTSKEGTEELRHKLGLMTEIDYKIISQEAGVRPSSIDRRPIIGKHPLHSNIYIFNGLGSKGVMLAPYFAKKFVHFLLQNEELPEEVNIKRFYHLYLGKKTQH